MRSQHVLLLYLSWCWDLMARNASRKGLCAAVTRRVNDAPRFEVGSRKSLIWRGRITLSQGTLTFIPSNPSRKRIK